MKRLALRCWMILVSVLFATPIALADDDYEISEEEYWNFINNDSIHGVTGIIPVEEAHAIITVPEGYVFLNKEQTKYLLCDYWGNHESAVGDEIGCLVSADCGIYNNVAIAYLYYYSDAGYVSDEDADNINYDDMIKDLKDSQEEANKELPEEHRMELVGWAWAPKYDKNNHRISWAKLVKSASGFESINYDIRILGREGYFTIEAVAGAEEKDNILASENAIINSITFDKGYTYEDFNPATDNIAKWTLGGLVAGKILAKAGFWAFLAKSWKLITIGAIAVFSAASGFIRRKKKVPTINDNSEPDKQE